MEISALDSAERASLIARIERRYPLQLQRLVFGNHELDIYSIADPDRVLLDMERDIRAAGTDDPRFQPYWARAWESAVAAGHLIADRDLTGQNVLDLGCGVAVAGTVAAACGASVLMADAAPASLLVARLNAWPWREQVRSQRLNWRVDRLEQRFHLILGADILYDRSDWPFLDQFWRTHLLPQGELLLVEPGRGISDGFVEFLEKQQRAGQKWRVESGEWRASGGVKTARPLRVYRATLDTECQ